MKVFRIKCAVAALAAPISNSAYAAVSVSKLFGDHMVIQAGVPVPVWGKGDVGAKVMARLAGQEASATVGADGKWRANFTPLAAGGPHTLEVVEAGNTLTIRDVLVGEVWLGSGQSNMAFTVARGKDAKAEIAAANSPQIRVFMVEKTTSQTPLEDLKGEWKRCTPENAAEFSAAGYFFAREVQAELKQPVGVIVAAIGAAAGESFVRRESLEANPKLKHLVALSDEREKAIPAARAEFEKLHDEWEAKMRAEGMADVLANPRTTAESRALGEPRPTKVLTDHQWAAQISNGMIQPIAPYAIRGVLWYQGEHNAKRAEQYRSLLPALIDDWRTLWKNDGLEFLIVQLPNYSQPKPEPGQCAWAEMREAQAMTAANVPHTHVAVTIDLGEVDIHPQNKQDVGKRLALQALKHVYSRDVIADAPKFVEAMRKGSTIRVKFDTNELTIKDTDLRGFTVAGSDRKFVVAQAKIDGGSVVVWSDAVSGPVAVRYAWADSPSCNLYGPGGLPVGSFRTDDWPGITAGVEK